MMLQNPTQDEHLEVRNINAHFTK